jgi:2-polyprenyl-3-methyl-5-hydroxy-6-metoxy-1,4-benzoquinol methylase
MFSARSLQPELLDGDAIPTHDLYQNLKELNTINTLLGGYNITFNALAKLTQYAPNLTIVDIGSGGGDTLKHIEKWSAKNNKQLKLYGIDLKQTCINYSISNNPSEGIQFICDDYTKAPTHVANIDVIHACLFCHHLSNEQIISLIQFCNRNKITLLINDLERNPIAYYSIKWLTQLLSKSYLVKNDAPLSVLRGFKKREWLQLLQQANATNYSVKWMWAFRHQIIVYANNA